MATKTVKLPRTRRQIELGTFSETGPEPSFRGKAGLTPRPPQRPQMPSRRQLLSAINTYTQAKLRKHVMDEACERHGQLPELRYAEEAVEKATKRLHDMIDTLYN